ncbi:MAG TPA: glycosyl transferase family 2 [Blastocatellia bacterium]|jgi:glycosyltransferase involved in cell wall biosynthesis|nr:glycosyl transferase family 2 [Blastocatellia bacterium]HAF25524.1 glycosyl transferase family 2 [Blastocatellia bacterium]HCX30679.1 glycosyl transferase family 2 [Blastocatellia bacterium]
MYKNRRIGVVVPAYNEASQIVRVIRTMPDYVDHLIVVDDCSSDGTFAAISDCIEDRRLALLQTRANLGVGGATIEGYLKAMELDCDVVAKMDGDGQMSPEHLQFLLNAIIEQDYDYAKGNRFLAGESLALMPRHRLVGNIMLTFVNKLASGYWNIFDPQNGYTAIKREALRRLDFNTIHKGYFFENDMLIALNLHNFRVRDVAIPARYGDEVSDLNPFKIGVTFPLLFIPRLWRRIYQKYVLRDFSPIALFLFLGLFLFGWGVFFGAYHWIKSLAEGHVTPTGTIMLSVLPLILGFQLVLQAIVLDIQETPR